MNFLRKRILSSRDNVATCEKELKEVTSLGLNMVSVISNLEERKQTLVDNLREDEGLVAVLMTSVKESLNGVAVAVVDPVIVARHGAAITVMRQTYYYLGVPEEELFLIDGNKFSLGDTNPATPAVSPKKTGNAISKTVQAPIARAVRRPEAAKAGDKPLPKLSWATGVSKAKAVGSFAALMSEEAGGAREEKE